MYLNKDKNKLIFGLNWLWNSLNQFKWFNTAKIAMKSSDMEKKLTNMLLLSFIATA